MPGWLANPQGIGRCVNTTNNDRTGMRSQLLLVEDVQHLENAWQFTSAFMGEQRKTAVTTRGVIEVCLKKN
jgi:hypothetical protein